MLAGVTHAHRGAVEGDQPLVMLDRDRRPLGAGERHHGAPGEPGRDLADEPGPPHGGTPDHHARRAGLREAGASLLERGHVTVGDDGDAHRLDHGPDRLPIGPALVELLPGSAVDGHPVEPERLGPTGEVGRVEAGMVPAQAHLHGDRNLDGPAHRRQQACGVVEVAHQRRAGLAAGHGLGRTAHVDVDGVGPVRHGDAGGLGHGLGGAAGELDDVRIDAGPFRPHL